MSEMEQRGRAHTDVMLLNRIDKLIDVLSPYQRDYHVGLRVDIYWYIEKRKEVELLASRLRQNDNEILRRYLDTLCDEINQRLEPDEKFVKEYFGNDVHATPKDKN